MVLISLERISFNILLWATGFGPAT